MKDKMAKKTQLMKKITFGYASGIPEATGSERNTDYIRIPEGDKMTKCRKNSNRFTQTMLGKTTEREIDFC